MENVIISNNTLAPYNAIDLSKYITEKCISDKYPITNLQLQKIMYYIQKAFLKAGTPAFEDDIQAWNFGPVVPEVYYYFCNHGAMPIVMTYKYEITLNEEDKKKIDSIVEQKRVLEPWDLVKETHTPNGAWDTVYRNGAGRRHTISKELIKRDA